MILGEIALFRPMELDHGIMISRQAVDTPSEPDARAWALRRALDAASNQAPR